VIQTLQIGYHVQHLLFGDDELAGRVVARRQIYHPVARFRRRLDVEQVGVGRHDGARRVRARLVQVAQVPVRTGLARADVEQVRAGAHGAQQVRLVVVVVGGHRGTAPAALVVRRLLRGAEHGPDFAGHRLREAGALGRAGGGLFAVAQLAGREDHMGGRRVIVEHALAQRPNEYQQAGDRQMKEGSKMVTVSMTVSAFP
jgi:hypothetical protein